MATAIIEVAQRTSSTPVDRAEVLDRVGGDEELVREIAAIFLDEYPVLLAKIQASVASNNPVQLERAAHNLKGSISNFGAPEATRAAYDLEMLGRNQRMQDAGIAVETLEREMDSVRAVLLSWLT
jgi:two-component system sensor histidine kinase/response regulator